MAISQTSQNALITKLEAPGHRVQTVAFSRDGKLIAAGYGFFDNGGIIIWNAVDKKVVARLLEKELKDAGITQIAFSDDGKLLAAASDDGDVILWRIGNWQRHQRVISRRGQATGLHFSPDNTKLAYSAEEILLIYDLASGKTRIIAQGKKDEKVFDGVSFTPDGKAVIAGGSKGTRIWEVKTNKIIKIWNNPSLNFFGRLSPTGNYFISGGGGIYGDKSIEIRNFPDGVKIKELTEFRDGVFTAAVSNSGKLFALAGGDYGGGGSLSLWSFEDDIEIGFASFGEMPIQGVAFSPDDKILAVASEDGAVLLYDVNRFKGPEVKKQDYALCGEIVKEGNKTFIVPLAKVPGIMRRDLGYAWKLQIANPDSVNDAIGSPVALPDWEIVSSAADDQARVSELKYLLPKKQSNSNYIVFGEVRNPGWNEGKIVKIFDDGSFITTNNPGQCLSYGNLSQLKTDYQTVGKRLLDGKFFSLPKEPLTLGTAHYRTQFIEIMVNGVSEIRSDADHFELLVKEKGNTKKRDAFNQIYGKEEEFLKSLLNAGFNLPTE